MGSMSPVIQEEGDVLEWFQSLWLVDNRNMKSIHSISVGQSYLESILENQIKQIFIDKVDFID